jgi:hypothetical protein
MVRAGTQSGADGRLEWLFLSAPPPGTMRRTEVHQRPKRALKMGMGRG